MIYGIIPAGEDAVILNPSKKLGPFRARAIQDMKDNPGGSAVFRVDLSGNRGVGLYEVSINVNNWDVYALDSPHLTSLLLDSLIPKEY